ncbi:hypothetical protein WJX64_02165 [Leifsonia sp. YIM 134122]|uniref:Uncharacterized protein n=1 Tax=Leifsonia stereocauli TaxID=3134136 RepID=A0ABU9W008_9MICO
MSDNTAADREELDREEDEVSPEPEILKEWLPDAEPSEGPAPAP